MILDVPRLSHLVQGVDNLDTARCDALPDQYVNDSERCRVLFDFDKTNAQSDEVFDKIQNFHPI